MDYALVIIFFLTLMDSYARWNYLQILEFISLKQKRHTWFHHRIKQIKCLISVAMDNNLEDTNLVRVVFLQYGTWHHKLNQVMGQTLQRYQTRYTIRSVNPVISSNQQRTEMSLICGGRS